MENAIAVRVNNYHKRLRGFRAMSIAVHNPRFNATKDAKFQNAYTRLGEWLKEEADSLWDAGVNVY